MVIFTKEVLEFSEKEREALFTVKEICADLILKASNPNLKKAAKGTLENLMELWGWEDE